jgi:hypothetical protein
VGFGKQFAVEKLSAEGVSEDYEANLPSGTDFGHEEGCVGECFEALAAGQAAAVVEEGAWQVQYQALVRTSWIQECKRLGCNNTGRIEEFRRLFAAQESFAGHTDNTSWATEGVD